MSSRERPRVLCVDHEAQALAAVTSELRNDYDVHTATSAEQALERLRRIRGAAVVVTDMRMHGMDGATLLQHVRETYPATTRIVLTGDGDRDVAVLAVNKGRLFHLLTKPCSPDELRVAIAAAVMQYRLRCAEQRLLQDTLIGCVGALAHALAITNPVAFSRASRAKQLAAEFAARLGCGHFWQLETAALLSQFGYISLRPEIVKKLYRGARLTAQEQALSAEVPHVAIKLLDHIPSLEPVLRILTALTWTDEQIARLGDGTIGLATRILGLVLEYDALTARGYTADVAVQTLRDRGERFSDALIEQFAAYVGVRAAATRVRELALRQMQPGMTLLQEVRADMGTLTFLLPRGSKVTPSVVARIGTLGPKMLTQRVRVLVPAEQPPSCLS